MPRRFQILLLLLASSMAATSMAVAPANPYWRDAWRGWHFYEEPEDEHDAAPLAPKAVPIPAKPRRAPELVEFEQLQKSLEEKRQVAIIRPSEANVRRYMELEAQVVAQASRFADVAQRVAWSSPELDPSLQGRPVNAKALEVFDQQQLADRSRSMQDLARDHVLIFAFRSDCPYCHAFAPTLDAFRRRHGLQVLAVTLDGGTLPGFADARRDNGIAANLRVTQVPAVFLAQPFTGQITPVGFGVMSEAQLLERISTVSSTPIDSAGSAPATRISTSSRGPLQ
ncbi:conjugal transfer protein TraF [Piscinibacter sakaiensis]|uniref:conjugal transfer protein TraF n=1 Tax=Piscinibacter sakaiensis TaxID=1547922 RepID=UPI003AB0F221